jgi:hypothetical protein
MRSYYTLFAASLLVCSLSASAEACNASKLARDSVRAIALISDRSMISDLVGGLDQHNDDQQSFRIWANYRAFNYSDEYYVTVSNKECRVTLFKLTESKLPVKEGDLTGS